jgi:hypothetical protein
VAKKPTIATAPAVNKAALAREFSIFMELLFNIGNWTHLVY